MCTQCIVLCCCYGEMTGSEGIADMQSRLSRGGDTVGSSPSSSPKTAADPPPGPSLQRTSNTASGAAIIRCLPVAIPLPAGLCCVSRASRPMCSTSLDAVGTARLDAHVHYI